MAKSKKLDIVWLVLVAVAVIGLVLTIVGVCIDYVGYEVTLFNNTTAYSFKWADLNEAQAEVDGYFSGLGSMQAMAIITIVLAGITAVFTVLSNFVNVKFAKIIKIALGVLTVIFAIVAIILASTLTDVWEIDYYAAAGAWLVLVGGILAGAAGVVAGLKK